MLGQIIHNDTVYNYPGVAPYAPESVGQHHTQGRTSDSGARDATQWVTLDKHNH
jgi:hypothetical protein